jgi:uncharacterized protein YfdQ (DUF2303 family)
VFADVDKAHVAAVIDYHGEKNDADNGAHRAVYTAPFSEEWKRWNAFASSPHDQVKFARFIEENEVDVIDPAGAEILEIAKTLVARKDVQFKSGIRLDNGDNDLQYVETTDGRAGAGGKLEIPNDITLAIPVFYGGPLYKVKAFFRYRISEGKLSLQVELHRTKEIKDAAFTDIVKALREGGNLVYEGTAPAESTSDY